MNDLDFGAIYDRHAGALIASDDDKTYDDRLAVVAMMPDTLASSFGDDDAAAIRRGDAEAEQSLVRLAMHDCWNAAWDRGELR